MLSRAVLLGSLLLGFGSQRTLAADASIEKTTTVGAPLEIVISDGTATSEYEVSQKPTTGELIRDPAAPRKFTYTPPDGIKQDITMGMEVSTKAGHGTPHMVRIHVIVWAPPVAVSPPDVIPVDGQKTIKLQAKGSGQVTFTRVEPQPKCGTVDVRKDTATYNPNGLCTDDEDDQFSFKANNSPNQNPASDSNIATVKLRVKAALPNGGPGGAGGPGGDKTRAPITLDNRAGCGAVTIVDKIATYTPTDQCSGEEVSFTTATPNSPISTLIVKAPAHRRFPFDWLLPAFSILLGLGAIGWAVLIHSRANKLKTEAEQDQRVAENRLHLLQTAIDNLEAKPTAGAHETPSSGDRSHRPNQQEFTTPGYSNTPQATPSASRNPESEYASRRTAEEPPISRQAARENASFGTLRAPTPQQAPLTPISPAYSSAPEIPTYASTPAAPASLSRLEKTGNIVADFNRAQSRDAAGYQWFLSTYSCIVLSCANLSDRRGNPTAELRFEEASRGFFLGALHDGQRLLLPAIDKDLDISRTWIEGAFTYRGDPDDDVRLLKPGLLRASGADWVLDRDGEIGRG